MKAVIKGAGYVLVHAPDMVVENGATQRTERIVNPDGDYLKELPSHIRSFEDALSYWPNQVYIGNRTPEDLRAVAQPWHATACDVAERYGAYGQIMPEAEFYLLMQACDSFDLVELDEGFVSAHREGLAANRAIGEEILARAGAGVETSRITELVEHEAAEPLVCGGRRVGCVKRAHEIDPNLSADTMLENLAAKASSVLSLLTLLGNAGIAASDVDYVIDCGEEACGDMNQRGGGNFAKAAAEIAGLSRATGMDARSFCAAPVHALIEAAALVSAGVYRTVVVTAGGCTAKLGMNGKDHVRKGLPILEDVLGGFAIAVTVDDGVNPVIDLAHIGRHTVGTGSAPQAVMQGLVYDPLEAAGLRATDIDRFSPEMQNPDITKPAGAGDVPAANYKMIAALGVRKGHLERADIPAFVTGHGLMGFAPTQGHIPSGVPSIGYLRDEMLAGRMRRAMVIGKGSLFLGRLTNLFDGVSFMLGANDGATDADAPAQPLDDSEVRGLIARAMRELAASVLAGDND